MPLNNFTFLNFSPSFPLMVENFRFLHFLNFDSLSFYSRRVFSPISTMPWTLFPKIFLFPALTTSLFSFLLTSIHPFLFQLNSSCVFTPVSCAFLLLSFLQFYPFPAFTASTSSLLLGAAVPFPAQSRTASSHVNITFPFRKLPFEPFS